MALVGSGRCVLCQKQIRGRAGICYACEKRYDLVGKPYKDYPEWIKFCYRDRARLYRRTKRETQQGLTSLDGMLDAGAQVDDWGKVYPEQEEQFIDDGLLRYAPYDDEKLNRQYRKANGIV